MSTSPGEFIRKEAAAGVKPYVLSPWYPVIGIEKVNHG